MAVSCLRNRTEPATGLVGGSLRRSIISQAVSSGSPASLPTITRAVGRASWPVIPFGSTAGPAPRCTRTVPG